MVVPFASRPKGDLQGLIVVIRSLPATLGDDVAPIDALWLIRPTARVLGTVWSMSKSGMSTDATSQPLKFFRPSTSPGWLKA
jgi:hypothetical protein